MEFYHFLEADFLSRTVPNARTRPHWALSAYLLNERITSKWMNSINEIEEAQKAQYCALCQAAGWEQR